MPKTRTTPSPRTARGVDQGEGVGNCPPGTKYDGAKLRYDLLPMGPLDQVVKVLTYGALKYAPDNWQQVPDAKNRYYAAAMRHLSAWKQGEANDSESDVSHLAHAACCMLFLLHFSADE